MSNKYDAFTALRNAGLNAAGFLDATARRVRSSGISDDEIAARCEDVAAILREANAAADATFFKPDGPRQKAGLAGGRARAAALSDERRQEIARTAADARWHGKDAAP